MIDTGCWPGEASQLRFMRLPPIADPTRRARSECCGDAARTCDAEACGTPDCRG